ncbi:hypothetical protein L208DRAFT_1413566, partial [Tricholoma matsutake]
MKSQAQRSRWRNMMTFKKLVTAIYMMQNRWAGMDWLRILLMTRALSITKKMIYLCKMYC